MPTLQDVARRAGISPSTASRVMNKYDGAFPISQKTRERVLEAARELGYVPNAAAQALRRGKTRTISVLGSSPSFFRISTDPANFHMAAMAGLMEAAIERGYHVNLLSGTETDPELGGAYADIGLTDGLLIINRDLDMDAAYVESLKRLDKPVMYALDYPDGRGFYATAPDDVEGGAMATRRLRRAGHKRIAFVRSSGYANIFDRRQAGWEKVMGAAAQRDAADLVMNVADVAPDAFAARGVTAALCANDTTGIRLHRKLEEGGVSVPGDVAMMVFTHEAEKNPTPVDFDGVAEPLSRIVSSAARRLIDLVEGRRTKKTELFAYNLKEGATV